MLRKIFRRSAGQEENQLSHEYTKHFVKREQAIEDMACFFEPKMSLEERLEHSK